MTRHAAVAALGMASVLAFAPLATGQYVPCNGTMSWPQVTQEEQDTSCPNIHHAVNYRITGTMQCNDVPYNGGVVPGIASAFALATGVCNSNPANPLFICDYVDPSAESRIRADGKGITVIAAWFNGSGTCNHCTLTPESDEGNDAGVNLCISDACCAGRDSCIQNGDRWFPESCRCVLSPLFVIFEGPWERALTSAQAGVPFVMKPGAPRARVAWTHPGTARAGLLVRDRNGNGWIDDGSELYGGATPQVSLPGQPRHGFTALATEDYDGNGWVDGHDPAFGEMAVWVDRNHDGISDAEELQSLADRGVTAISLRYTVLERDDAQGNRFAYVSDMVMQSGGRARTARVYDVYPQTVPLEPPAGCVGSGFTRPPS
ncbi:MAG: hypothetical protein KA745_08915 [Gemmatimonadales bacterium]|nr:hypothetical protein [Gemmatimonadales bacterium]